MPSSTPILLLKTRSSPHDGYDEIFSRHDYRPSFIPVLEHRFHAENLGRVRELFASGAFETSNTHNHRPSQANANDSHRKYGGMIFTSQRAVEAFANMIEEEGRRSRSANGPPPLLPEII